jgi:hypothetical protein
MVPLGIFGIAKLYWEVFTPAPAIGTVKPLFVVIDGLPDGVVGAYVAWIVVGLALLSTSFPLAAG